MLGVDWDKDGKEKLADDTLTMLMIDDGMGDVVFAANEAKGTESKSTGSEGHEPESLVAKSTGSEGPEPESLVAKSIGSNMAGSKGADVIIPVIIKAVALVAAILIIKEIFF